MADEVKPLTAAEVEARIAEIGVSATVDPPLTGSEERELAALLTARAGLADSADAARWRFVRPLLSLTQFNRGDKHNEDYRWGVWLTDGSIDTGPDYYTDPRPADVDAAIDAAPDAARGVTATPTESPLVEDAHPSEELFVAFTTALDKYVVECAIPNNGKAAAQARSEIFGALGRYVQGAEKEARLGTATPTESAGTLNEALAASDAEQHIRINRAANQRRFDRISAALHELGDYRALGYDLALDELIRRAVGEALASPLSAPAPTGERVGDDELFHACETFWDHPESGLVDDRFRVAPVLRLVLERFIAGRTPAQLVDGSNG